MRGTVAIPAGGGAGKLVGMTLPPWFAPRTIPALLAVRAASARDRRAVVAADGDITFAELWSRARRVAGSLGVEPGARVAWAIGNERGVAALTLYHGVLCAGAVNIPLNTRLTARERDAILERARPALVVDDVDALLDGAEVDPAPAGEDDVASILFTSGTTGLPKGVVHTHATSLAAAAGWADAFRLGTNDVVQSPFPVFTGAGLHFNGLAALWAGAANVIDGAEVAESLARIAAVGATVYVAVPSIYQFWLDHPALATADLSSLRILDYGGASMAPDVIRRLHDAIPRAGLMQTYGLTEAGPGGLYLAEEYAFGKLGSVGNRAAGAGTQFRVVDEHSHDVPADGIGELVLRGPSVMQGYFEDDEATAAAFTADGWLRSGDVVRIDAQGFVFHVDRIKDIIVRGGFNIASVEVESVLLEHDDVLEAAVVGRPHPKLGEDVHAVVVPKAGRTVDVDVLVTHCRTALADFKVPRTIDVRDEPLPRNASGKVLKRELR